LAWPTRQTIQRNEAFWRFPFVFTAAVPLRIANSSSGVRTPERIKKCTVFAASSTSGSSQTLLLGLVESENDFTKGIWAPQAGLGHCTVLAQSHAITVASLPP